MPMKFVTIIDTQGVYFFSFCSCVLRMLRSTLSIWLTLCAWMRALFVWHNIVNQEAFVSKEGKSNHQVRHLDLGSVSQRLRSTLSWT